MSAMEKAPPTCPEAALLIASSPNIRTLAAVISRSRIFWLSIVSSLVT